MNALAANENSSDNMASKQVAMRSARLAARNIKKAPVRDVATLAGPADPSKTCFLDLPAEIRNRIYTLALVHELPLTISLCRTLDVEHTPTYLADCLVLVTVKQSLDGQHSAACLIPCAERSDLVVKLLRTSRQVHDEATPMFYGLNTFNIGDMDRLELEGFQQKIGASIRHVRLLQIGEIRLRSQIPGLLVALKKFTGLIELDLPAYRMGKHCTPREMALKLRPLVNHFSKIIKNKDPQTDVVDMISFTAKYQWEGLMHVPKIGKMSPLPSRIKDAFKEEAQGYEEDVKMWLRDERSGSELWTSLGGRNALYADLHWRRLRGGSV